MKPLFILLGVFGMSIVINKLFRGNYNYATSARIAMAAMLVFTAIGHFAFARGMSLMLPDFIPFKTETVYLTGILEVIAAIGLLFPKTQYITGCLLIAFFILILPANIYASMRNLNYQTGNFDGNGLSYLWFRIPLQILFIIWVYLSTT